MENDVAGLKGVAAATLALILLVGAGLVFVVGEVRSGPPGAPDDKPGAADDKPVQRCPKVEDGDAGRSRTSAVSGEGAPGRAPTRLFVLPKPGGRAAGGAAGGIDPRTLVALRDQIRETADQLLAPIEAKPPGGDAGGEVLNRIAELLAVISQRLPPPAEAQPPAGGDSGR